MTTIRVTYSNGWDFAGQSPVLRIVRGEIAYGRERNGLKVKDFETAKRCSQTTVRNWTTGRTKRPQFDKVAAVLDLLGKEIVVRSKQTGG